MIQIDTSWIYDLAKFVGAVGAVSSFFVIPIWRALKKQINKMRETDERAKLNAEILQAHEQAIQESKLDRADIHHTLENSKILLLALVRSQLIRLCEQLIDKGYVTADDLEELEDLYQPYKLNGGNGLGHTLYTRAKSLPAKSPERKDV